MTLSYHQISAKLQHLQCEKKFRITFADTNAGGNVSQFEYAKYFGIVCDLMSVLLTLEADFINASTAELHARASQQIVYTDIKGIPRRVTQEFRVLIEAMIS